MRAGSRPVDHAAAHAYAPAPCSRYRAQMLLWSVLGAPLILGADIRKIDNFTKALITAPEVLAVNADPDCVQGSLLRSRGSYEVWGKPLSRRVDTVEPQTETETDQHPAVPYAGGPVQQGAIAVVLFNKGAVNTTVTLIPQGPNNDFYPVSGGCFFCGVVAHPFPRQCPLPSCHSGVCRGCKQGCGRLRQRRARPPLVPPHPRALRCRPPPPPRAATTSCANRQPRR